MVNRFGATEAIFDQGRSFGLVSAHLKSRAWGNIARIASVALDIFTCRPYMSNFKSVACPVCAVGGGGLGKRHTIYKYVAICTRSTYFSQYATTYHISTNQFLKRYSIYIQ